MKEVLPLIVLFLLALPLTAQEASSDYEGCLQSGWEARQNKEFDKALNAYLCAVRANDASVDAWLGIMYTHIENNEFEKALPVARKLLEMSPENIWVRKGAAYAFYMLKDYARAAEHYTFVLSQVENDPEMQLGLGLSLVFGGKKEEGRMQCEKAATTLDSTDTRVKECLEVAAAPDPNDSYFKGALYVSGLYYTEAWSALFGIHSTLVADYKFKNGIGLLGDFSYSFYRIRYQRENVHLYSPAIAGYYLSDKLLLWLHAKYIQGDEKVFSSSLYGRYDIASIHLSTGVSYSWFESSSDVVQLEPGFYYTIGDVFTIGVSAVSQFFIFGKEEGQKSERISGKLELALELKYIKSALSGYYGRRMKTVEDKGLTIWTGYQEYDFGMELELQPFWQSKVNPYLSFRFDHILKEAGLSHDSFSISGTIGIETTF